VSKVRTRKGCDSSFDSATVFISSSGKSNPKSSGTSRNETAFSFHFAHVFTPQPYFCLPSVFNFRFKGLTALEPF
jgi:hypothetical protein